MAPLEPLAVVPPPSELANRLHASDDLGIVYLRARLNMNTAHDRFLLDIVATAAARVLEGKPLGTWPEEAFREQD